MTKVLIIIVVCSAYPEALASHFCALLKSAEFNVAVLLDASEASVCAQTSHNFCSGHGERNNDPEACNEA